MKSPTSDMNRFEGGGELYAQFRPEHPPEVCVYLASQAAHWFDLPQFFREVRRVGVDQGVEALISCGVLTLDSAVDQRFQKFYWQEIGPFWPPERKLVDTGYADILFPFAEIAAPKIGMCKQCLLSASAEASRGTTDELCKMEILKKR